LIGHWFNKQESAQELASSTIAAYTLVFRPVLRSFGVGGSPLPKRRDHRRWSFVFGSRYFTWCI